jgi:hypothetical protein
MWSLRKNLLKLLAVAALASPALFAQPMCQTGTLQSYINNPCMLDGFVFKNFTFTPMGNLAVTASNITVTPTLSAAAINLNFKSPLFSVPTGISETFLINYFIDPGPVIVNGFRIDLVNPDPVVLTTTVCEGAQFSGPLCNSPSATLIADSAQPQSAMFPELVNVLDVRNRLDLNGTGGRPASVDSFDNGALLFATPEPGAVFLTGSGLLGLLGFRSRAKLREVFLKLRA